MVSGDPVGTQGRPGRMRVGAAGSFVGLCQASGIGPARRLGFELSNGPTCVPSKTSALQTGVELLTFTADASAGLSGPEWLMRRRSAAWERFQSATLPTESDDLWKYSGIEKLDLHSFAPATLGSRVRVAP